MEAAPVGDGLQLVHHSSRGRRLVSARTYPSPMLPSRITGRSPAWHRGVELDQTARR
jgi:hypothetical protein